MQLQDIPPPATTSAVIMNGVIKERKDSSLPMKSPKSPKPLANGHIPLLQLSPPGEKLCYCNDLNCARRMITNRPISPEILIPSTSSQGQGNAPNNAIISRYNSFNVKRDYEVNNNTSLFEERFPSTNRCYCRSCNASKYSFCPGCRTSSSSSSTTTTNNNNYKSASIAVPQPNRVLSQPVIKYPYPQAPRPSQTFLPSVRLEGVSPRDHHVLFDPWDRSHHGCFRKSVPSMPMLLAILFCLFNFFVPGVGTLLATFTVLFGCSTEYGKERKMTAFFIGLFIAVVQMLTAIIVLGWVWSIMWGINFIKRKL